MTRPWKDGVNYIFVTETSGKRRRKAMSRLVEWVWLWFEHEHSMVPPFMVQKEALKRMRQASRFKNIRVEGTETIRALVGEEESVFLIYESGHVREQEIVERVMAEASRAKKTYIPYNSSLAANFLRTYLRRAGNLRYQETGVPRKAYFPLYQVTYPIHCTIRRDREVYRFTLSHGGPPGETVRHWG